MKITLIQSNPEWRSPERNRRALTDVLRSAEATDLFVLPEMFATGFCVEPLGVAEPEEGPTLQWMKRMATERAAALAGSVAVEQEGRCYNRLYLVEPDGAVHAYDKRHLFTYGGENRRFTAGCRRVVVPFRGVRILLQVCYDLRFPVWARNRRDYDLALYVASWPASRETVWHTLLQARAIENQCYVAGVNRVGTDPQCAYTGGSRVVDPYGRIQAACTDGCADCISTVIDTELLNHFRRKFPVLDDADNFEGMG